MHKFIHAKDAAIETANRLKEKSVVPTDIWSHLWGDINIAIWCGKYQTHVGYGSDKLTFAQFVTLRDELTRLGYKVTASKNAEKSHFELDIDWSLN